MPKRTSQKNLDKTSSVINELKESEIFFRHLAENTPEAIAIHQQGILVYANKAALKFVGAKRPDEVLGKNIMQFVHPDSRSLVKERVKDMLVNKKVVPFIEEKYVNLQGKEICAQVKAVPFKFKGEAAILVILRDVTKAKEVEEKLDFQVNILKNVTESIIVTDLEGKVIYWNEGAEKTFGYKATEMLGHTPQLLYPELENVDQADEPKEVFKDNDFQGEWIGRKKDGKTVWLDMKTTLMHSKNGEVIGYLSIAKDITDRKKIEDTYPQFSAIVESSDDAIVSKTLDGTIRTWNKSAERIFGYSAKEAVGKNIRFIIPIELHYEEDEIIKKLRSGQRIEHFETTRLRKDGKRITVSLSISPIRNKLGKIVGASKLARDISDWRKTERALLESEERLRIALEAGNVGVWDWNLKEDTLIWTNKMYLIHGLSKDTFIPTVEKYFSIIDSEDRDMVRSYVDKAIKENVPYNVIFRTRTPDDQIKWMQASATVFRDERGDAIRMLGAVSDITRQKQLEQEKSDFLSMASHELKTPLTSMKMFIDLLVREFKGSEPERVSYYASRIKDQANRLSELTNDLLDVSRIETGKLRLSIDNFRLDELITDTIESMQAFGRKHEIVIGSNEEIVIPADRYRTFQVLINLLTNAIKYSPQGKKIIVSTKKNSEDVVISVKDFGIGIKKNQQEKIFERLYQVNDSEEKTYPGFGLGLYISKEIVERHNGRIWVESVKGKGSTFFVSLPLNQEKRSQ